MRPNILALQPYSTARDEYAGGGIDVWLDANESPYDNGVNRYPDPHQQALKAPDRRTEGRATPSGSSSATAATRPSTSHTASSAGRALDNAVSIAPTYGMYRVAADDRTTCEMREVPLGAGLLAPGRTRCWRQPTSARSLLWLCSPEQPHGQRLPGDRRSNGCSADFDGMVVLDEAYIDFADGAGIPARGSANFRT